MRRLYDDLVQYKFVLWFLSGLFLILVMVGPQTLTLKPMGRFLFALFAGCLVGLYIFKYIIMQLSKNPEWVHKQDLEEYAIFKIEKYRAELEMIRVQKIQKEYDAIFKEYEQLYGSNEN